jgi:hypothetical protein
MRRWLPPYKIELETWGKHYGDVADVGDDLIASERFRRSFESSTIRGFSSFEPVEVVRTIHRRGEPRHPRPEYYKISVVHSPTSIDQEASGYVWGDPTRVCQTCLFDTLKRYRCMIVTEATWNGDDIFHPRGGNGILVSERFREIFHGSGLHGCEFVPSESPEAGYDSFPWETSGTRLPR